ncbi:alpha/beta hydrolase-fold protein [Caulobacter sp. FWC2]|uniref:alpha/beta hydrolase-fold protein n=1 Tax=Caulobacter sp. FWC2 TaxID=69664 RepID=UPI001E4615C6|nr:alpha/beta hydrolase-fold protein [Caulobacter sp. FWC2]
MPRLAKRDRYLLSALLLLGLLWFGWTELTKTRGDQKVDFQPATRDCGAEGALRYCVYRAVGGVNGDIVYHLHGRGLDERIWNDDTYLTAMLQARWQVAGAPPPTVVTLSYGPSWLLTPKGRMADSGLLDDMMRRLPAIEAKVGSPRRRMLLGESMGGLNVLIAGLSYPDKFAKVAALCPGVYVDSPFAKLSTLVAAAQRTGANPKIAFGIRAMAQTYAADDAEWRRVSPIALIKRATPAYPALYLSCGLYDNYGNFEGSERLVSMARERGVQTEWRPLYGGHCVTDANSVGDFLLK